MAEKSDGKSVAVQTGTETNAKDAVVKGDRKVKQEQRFKVEKLRANCMQLFKITTSTFDGAMYGHSETEMTIAEAKAIIDKWLGRKER